MASGKNSKFLYYLRCYLRQCELPCITQKRGLNLLEALEQNKDNELIFNRINYYCKLSTSSPLSNATTLKDIPFPKKQKVYFFDSQEYLRYFPKHLRCHILPGDINFTPNEPSIVKSRPIAPNNENGVLLNMDKVRHFVFLHDSHSVENKMGKAIFRGAIHGKPNRIAFMEQYFGSSFCDCADVVDRIVVNPTWQAKPISLYKHLVYRYIICLEGNDVASNLKWVMSSNSVAIMPRPTCETWFMEGRLKPNFHYIEIKPDFSDLEEKIDYYNAHLDEAKQIVANAHAYIEQFKNKQIEDMISVGVLKKYFEMTNYDK